MTQPEEWRPVRGHPGYEVSNLGRVRSWCRDGEPRIMKLGTNPSRGYRQVRFNKRPNPKTRFVHQLVLEAFVGPRPDGMVARHYPDQDRTNNSLANLSWGTPILNQADRIEHGTDGRGERHPAAKLNQAQVLEIRGSNTQPGHEARRFGVSDTTIRLIRSGRRWRHLADDALQRRRA